MCLLVTTMSCAEPVEMPFGFCTWVGPSNHVLGGGPDTPEEEAVLRASSGPLWSGGYIRHKPKLFRSGSSDLAFYCQYRSNLLIYLTIAVLYADLVVLFISWNQSRCIFHISLDASTNSSCVTMFDCMFCLTFDRHTETVDTGASAIVRGSREGRHRVQPVAASRTCM